jgi:hypothetical protein
MKPWLSSAIKNGIEIILVRDDFTSFEKIRFDDELREEICSKSVQVVDVAFQSPGLSRNSGMQLAKTQWITFWDCDDSPEPESIVEEINSVSESVDFVVGQYSINGSITFTRDIYDVALNPGNWRIVYRHSSIVDLEFTKELWGEDQLFVIESNLLDSVPLISTKRFYDYKVGSPTQITANRKNVTSLMETLKSVLAVLLRESRSGQGKIPHIMMLIRMSMTIISQCLMQREGSFILVALKLNLIMFFRFPKCYLIALFKVLSKLVSSK